MDEWRKTAAIQASKDRRITLHAAVCMPDYFHGVIEVGERMDVSIGNIILFKGTLLESGYPLIHIQKEPIFRYWKPEASRFHACENGSLLILAPWSPEKIGDVNGIPQRKPTTASSITSTR